MRFTLDTLRAAYELFHLFKQPPKMSGTNTKRNTNLRTYLLESLRVDWLVELQLLLLTFSTGIQDAISFPDFHCFASNQTGNSVILAVGISGIGDSSLFDIRSVSISLGMFIAGALSTGQLAHAIGPQQRLWLFINHLIQTLMVVGAAIIQAHNLRKLLLLDWIAIALLAFSSGAQVASMRPMRIQEITTAMATAAWVDLVIDKDLVVLKNHSRDRRALFLAALIVGSFAGAYMHVKIGSSNALFVSAAGKLLVTITLLLNRRNASDTYIIRS